MTDLTEVEALRLALLAAAVVIVILVIAFVRARSRIARGNRRRQQVARAGEEEAERLLGELGWQVVERQVTRAWAMEVDGETREVRCRADLVVCLRARPRQRFVAEVKTGDRAPLPTLPATRRQLLEYALVFEVEGVLLLDMDRRQVRVVRFPWLG